MKFNDFMLIESINDKGIFKALFVIGSAGAGKSYTISNLNGIISPKIVNTDRFLEFYAKKIGVKANSDNWRELFRDKTKHTTKQMTYNYLNGMLPLFIDSTSNDVANILSRAAVLESIGYDVGFVYVHADLDTVIKRVQKRNQSGNREVDLDFVKRAHEKTNTDIEFLKGKGHFFLEIDNSDGEMTNEIMHTAFKKAQSFFKEDLKNPIGNRTIKKLKDSSEKYLVPEIFTNEELQNKVERWYK